MYWQEASTDLPEEQSTPDQTELTKLSMKAYELLLMTQPAATPYLADEINDANDQAVSVAIQAN